MQSTMRFVFNETEVRGSSDGGHSATKLRHCLLIRKLESNAAISHSAFSVPKTFNQRGLQFRFPSYLVGDRVASLGCATKSAVVDCDCCHQPLVGSSSQWGCLMRIVETMQKADWPAIISRVTEVALLLAGVLLAAGLCAATPQANPVPSIFDSRSTPADSIRHLSFFVLSVTGARFAFSNVYRFCTAAASCLHLPLFLAFFAWDKK